jgi:Ca-activated chloride channel family protein
MMIALDRPWFVLGGVALAIVAAALVLVGFARRRARLANYGAPEALARLAPPDAGRRPVRRALALALATLCLAIAIAGPRWGASTSILESEGIDVAIALDVSLSMLAEDERPSRLERMKQEVRRLRAAAPGDRVALIAFAGRSYILSPLTSDDGALDLFLSNLDPSIVGQAGSNIALPIRQGIELLSASTGDADRALVIMSDGEAFDDHEVAVRMAGEAKAAGIHVVTVAFGTAGGATIPLPGTGGADVKRDDTGEIVITKVDDRLLEAIAVAAGGEHVPSDATDKGNRIRRALGVLEASAQQQQLKANRPLQYQWFVAMALLILLVDALYADGARWPRVGRRTEVPRPDGPERRNAARVGVLLFLLAAPTVAHAQGTSLEQAIAMHRAERPIDAIKAYRALIEAGDRRAVVLYNLGTALLAADSLDAAIESLERVTFIGDAALRRTARYNLGVAFLRRGLRLEGEGRTAAMKSAQRAFRTVLLETPGDRNAQWNYELAMRTAQGGGGGGRTGPQQGPPPPEPSPQGQMTRQQAEALLDASAREERDVQARRRRGEGQGRATGQRDW